VSVKQSIQSPVSSRATQTSAITSATTSLPDYVTSVKEGGFYGSDLCHQKDLLPVAIAESMAHPDLADAAVIVPAVIHEGDAAIDCASK
jgi:hypothetical protein